MAWNPQKSRYIVEHLHKYSGNPDRITARSAPERTLMKFFDTNANVKKWNSEGVVVHYISPVDGERHRYIVDFYAELVDGTKLLIEYKPYDHTIPPTPPKRQTKKSREQYEFALRRWAVNQAKWAAAKAYAEKIGVKFAVWTEQHLRALGMRVL